MLKFFYNGIKGADGKLQKCHYSDGALLHHPAGTITIYGKDYIGFSKEVAEQFEIENRTDYQTDYFDQDHIRVTPDHPLYPQVLAALQKQEAHREARIAKRKAKTSTLPACERLPLVGDCVGFVYGPGDFPQDHAGNVVGIQTDRFGTYAIVLMNNTGEIKRVHGMTEVGIGCHYLKEETA